MRVLDFRRPDQCLSLPLSDRAGAMSRILLQRALPFGWLFRVHRPGRSIEASARPGVAADLRRMFASIAPHATEADIERFVRRSLLIRRVGGQTFAGVFRRSREWLVQRLRPEGLDVLEKVRQEGKGAIVLGTHAGMTGWMPAILIQLGFPMWLTPRARIPADALLLLRWSGWVSRVLPFPDPADAGVHLKRLHDILGRGEWIHHTGDYPDREKGIPGKCFGFDVRCRRAPWALARSSGAPLIPALVLLNADFSARLVVGPALYVDARSPAMEAMTAAFQTYLDFVEANLRSQPWNGYLHLLWKSRVGPGASP